jgi:hypothetical protein
MAVAALANWQTFYEIIGSSAGALIGLQFVAMSLISNAQTQPDAEAGHAFATPTIVHFAAVLGLAGVLAAPWEDIDAARALWGAAGFAGMLYAVLVARRMRKQTAYRPEFEDWMFHAVLPFTAYLALAISAFVALFRLHEALFVVGATALGLLFIGIHNVWDAVTYHIFSRKRSGPQS